MWALPFILNSKFEQMGMHIKIAITDDHPMVVTGIRNMLYYQKHIEVANVYYTGQALLEGLRNEQPDVLLLDIQLPDQNGNELARIISKTYPSVRILAITSMDSIYQLKDMMRSGCSGYLLKTAPKEMLLEAIEKIYAGEEYIEPTLKEQLLNSVLKIRQPKTRVAITRREKEILGLIAGGLTSHQIAEQLSLSQRTVENHRFSLMQKLNVRNSMGLARIAMQMGLLDK
jgi:DNA-binding NarL/FixJ family response regulator